MATLEKIRNKAGVLIAGVIGLALLAFILGDLLDSRKSLFTGGKNDVAKIAGKSIPVQLLEQKINDLTEIYKMNSGQSNLDETMTDNIREQAWQQLVNEYVMTKEFDKLGLAVSPEELFDQMEGANPHQIVRQIFTNPQTGEFNKALLMQFLKGTNDNPTGDQMKFRLYIENEIKNDRVNTKYNTLIRKGLSAPTFLAKNDYNETSKKVDFSYVSQRYNSIPDNAVKITDADLKNYYSEHKYLYEIPNASRDVEYVSFDIVPSKEDQAAAATWINKIKPDFAAATEVEQFVNSNSDVPYADKNYKQSQLPDSLGSTLFNASVGTVYGPYLENGSFKLARLYKVVTIADSVKARHILIAPKGQAKADTDKAKSIADSLKNLIDKGADFAALANQYSDDKGSAVKGGDLGWFQDGAMVKPFNDAAFEGKKGETKVVETRYGYHILQVEDKGAESKKVKVAIIERKVEASSQTYQQIYATSMKFASENRSYDKFNAAIAKQKLVKKVAPSLGENDKTIAGIEQQPRQLIKWAYKSKKSDISEPIDLGNRYVVAALTEVREKGIASLEQVKNEVEVAVRRQKKAEKLAEIINKAKTGATSIQDLALKLNTQVEMANDISFSSYSLPSAGIEPKLIAYATNYAKNKLSEPIDGNNGVFVVFVTRETQTPAVKGYADSKMRLNYTFQARASYDCYAALRKLANIEDKRSIFY
ncbi:MAG: SurA N-terminal domain-containing protein [Bacteroidota bacterium]|nr:SurA N-terminal domain-containing protein [Bacteroidota bacterium]